MFQNEAQKQGVMGMLAVLALLCLIFGGKEKKKVETSDWEAILKSYPEGEDTLYVTEESKPDEVSALNRELVKIFVEYRDTNDLTRQVYARLGFFDFYRAEGGNELFSEILSIKREGESFRIVWMSKSSMGGGKMMISEGKMTYSLLDMSAKKIFIEPVKGSVKMLCAMIYAKLAERFLAFDKSGIRHGTLNADDLFFIAVHMQELMNVMHEKKIEFILRTIGKKINGEISGKNVLRYISLEEILHIAKIIGYVKPSKRQLISIVALVQTWVFFEGVEKLNFPQEMKRKLKYSFLTDTQ
ncbi:MAG: hypothetical protein HY453_00680 [Parcubacteria group bacterium]|nr:hypothetical protein [Parcubacteria group bacterium]